MPKYVITRRETVDVSAQKAIQAIADFGTWRTWSPWLLVEPEASVTVSEPPNEIGSTYQWHGAICGAGKITHLSVDPGQRVRCELRFLRPMKSVCEIELVATPLSADRCEVTWTMRGKLPWFLFWVKGMIETFVGMDYERGLRMLKEYLETGEVSSKLQIIGVEEQPERQLLGLKEGATMDEIGESMQRTMSRVDTVITDPADRGTAAAFYHSTSDLRKRWFDYSMGYLLEAPSSELRFQSLRCQTLPSGRYFVIRHTGSYQHLGNAWMGGVQVIRYQKLKMSKAGGYEIYRDRPSDEDHCKDHVTDVYIRVK